MVSRSPRADTPAADGNDDPALRGRHRGWLAGQIRPGEEQHIARQDDVYRTFRDILYDFQREALLRSLTISEERVGTIIIQKTVRSLSTAGARLLTLLMQSYNPSGALPKEVGWMLAGVTQMKFIAELESLPRGLSIGPLLEGVARSLFEAVDIRQARA